MKTHVCNVMAYASERTTAVRCLVVLLVFYVATTSVQAQIVSPFQAPPLRLIRYEENYAYLADTTKRRDCTDALKYIPLGGVSPRTTSEGAWYLSLGGESRTLYEFYQNPDWGLEFRGNYGYVLQRTMLHADLHAGRHLRFFAQVGSGLGDGRAGGPSPVDKDVFDVHQAFLETSFMLSDSLQMRLRVGRQEMVYGSARLITVRDGPNLRLSFDGIRATFSDQFSPKAAWTLNLFATRPVRNLQGVLDNPVLDSSRALWGAYLTVPTSIPSAKADLYYLGFERQRARFDEGFGYELRHSVGSRFFGKIGLFDYNLEALYQFGQFATGIISAWTASMNVGYTFEDLTFTPRLGLRSETISGDRTRNDGVLNTFNPLFPRGAYFGGAGLIGPANLNDIHPTIDFFITDNITLTADWDIFWRDSPNDGVYNVVGQFLTTGSGFAAIFIGHQPNIEVEWNINRYTSFWIQYAHFFSGDFLKERGLESVNFATAYLQFRF